MTPADLTAIIDAAGKATGWDRISIDATHAEHLARIALAAMASVRNTAWAGVCDEDIELERALRDAGLIS